MFSSAVRRAAEAVDGADPVAPAGLVPLAELAAEGVGYGEPFVRTPRDAIEALARQLGDQDAVLIDDFGRQSVARETSRRLLAERAAAERRWREEQERHQAELAQLEAANRPHGGIPIPEGG
jgi:hypothetical protein